MALDLPNSPVPGSSTFHKVVGAFLCRYGPYATIPETLELREIRYNIVEPGRRTSSIDLITTLTDADLYEVVPVFRARSGLRMNGQGDLQDERKEQEAGVECTTTVHR